jgi:hypothetical protein
MGSMQGLGHAGACCHLYVDFQRSDRSHIPNMSRTNANVRRRFLITLAAALMGCGSEDPTKPPFGEELTVAEQVAVEVAFGRVADSLDKVRNTPDDSVMADLTRTAARLVRLQGRYGTINVQLPGVAGTTEMKAVAFTGSDAGTSANVMLAWEELDVAAFTVKRAIVFQSGGFVSTLAAQMRYLDMSGETTSGLYFGGGLLTFTAPRFTNNCTGLENTDEESCRAGQITVSGQADIRRSDDVNTTAVSFSASQVAGFEVKVQ